MAKKTPAKRTSKSRSGSKKTKVSKTTARTKSGTSGKRIDFILPRPKLLGFVIAALTAAIAILILLGDEEQGYESPKENQSVQAPIDKTAVPLMPPKPKLKDDGPIEIRPHLTERMGQKPWQQHARLVDISPRSAGIIAIVIDDLGPNLARSKAALALPAPVTMAVLPYADHAEMIARDAYGQGHEIMLHMPMQPRGDSLPGPNALMLGMTRNQIKAALTRAMAKIPYAAGFNNHMGSLASTDNSLMKAVLAWAADKGYLYLDSRTTAETKGPDIAATMPLLPYTQRDLFLDHVQEENAIRGQLAKIETIARRRGNAIAIGHPYPETLAVLQDWIPKMQEKGFQLVPVSAVIQERLEKGTRLDRLHGIY